MRLSILMYIINHLKLINHFISKCAKCFLKLVYQTSCFLFNYLSTYIMLIISYRILSMFF